VQLHRVARRIAQEQRAAGAFECDRPGRDPLAAVLAQPCREARAIGRVAEVRDVEQRFRVEAAALPGAAANFAWGGEDGRTLFLCARTGLYRLDTLVCAAGDRRGGKGAGP